MMITANFQTPVARACGNTTPQPPAQQPPAEQPPVGDGIDLTSLDCPYKVAQHPLLEPAFQLGITGAVAVAIASMWGGGQVPALQLALNSFIGDSNYVGTSYAIDPGNQEGAVKAEGNFVSGTTSGFISGGLANMMDQQVAWNGSFGDNPEALSLRTDETGEKLLVDGTIGTVPTSLTYSLIGGSSQPEGIIVDGKIGDLPYHNESRWSINAGLLTGSVAPVPGVTVDLGTMTSRGTIGEREISKDYKLTAEVDMENKSGFFHAVGTGVNAGVPQSVCADLAVGQQLPGLQAS